MARTRKDENTAPLWIETGEQQQGQVATVAPVIPINKTYTFAVPAELEPRVKLGQRVEIKIGRAGRRARGFVIALDRRVWDSTLRPLVDVVEDESFLTPALIELGRFVSRHYHCPLGQTLKAMTPEAARIGRGLKTVRYARLGPNANEAALRDIRLTPARQSLLDVLRDRPKAAPGGTGMAVEELLAEAEISSAVLRGAEKAGLVSMDERKEAPPAPTFGQGLREPDHDRTDEQSAALAPIAADVSDRKFSVSLLFGVSGSGKTEVYVHAIRQAVAAGGQAILLVPEIMLTTQLVERLAARFDDVAVSHSGLTEVQRSLIWREIAAGRRKVVIGTRSAVFAPCPDLRLICVDEEQESSYKNQQAPRFHVRDVAVMRAHQIGIPAVLGSATPSLESWFNSEHRDNWRRLILSRRVKNLQLPEVAVINMRDEHAVVQQASVLSRKLVEGLRETVQAGEQAVLLMNRRGFAQRVVCEDCGTQLRCSNCDVGLVFHTSSGVSMCHYCRQRIPEHAICQVLGCGGRLTHKGVGTQRVEQILQTMMPDARIQRADSDSMTSRESYQQTISALHAGEIDVVVGTQMIAKGLDFPNVSFVGVIEADPSFAASGFRAQEHLFQLLTQVAGRAGRAKGRGRVVLQTNAPDAPALKYARSHDFAGFAEAELAARKAIAMPPWRRLTRIILAGEREEAVAQDAARLADELQAVRESAGIEHGTLLGPQPCPLARIRQRYRYDLLLRTVSARDMHNWLDAAAEASLLRSKHQLTVDVDPIALA